MKEKNSSEKLQNTNDSNSRLELAMALTHIRKSAGLTQNQVAKKIKKNQSFISRMESKHGPFPDRASIVSFAQACNYCTGYLFTLKDNKAFAISLDETAEFQQKFTEKMQEHGISNRL